MTKEQLEEIKQYAIIYFRDNTNNPLEAVMLGLETFLKKNELKIVKTSDEEVGRLTNPAEQT